MITVSIIIPAHNPGRYLREAIQSVHTQTFTDWELVVVDDNSTEDLTWVPVEFPRARLIRQPHGGVSVARNNGILNTSGELIAFMDQDDLWKPRKLERQVAAMAGAADLGLCHSDLEFIGPEGEMMGKNTTARSPESSVQGCVVELDGTSEPDRTKGVSKLHRSILYFKSQFAVPSTVMIRRSCLATSGLFDPFIPFTGDYDLIVKLGACYKIARIPFADVQYRRHSNNFSNQYEVSRSEVEALVAKYGAFARGKGDVQLANKVKQLFRGSASNYSAQAFDRARKCLHERDFRLFVAHLVRAFVWNPRYVSGSVSRYLVSRLGTPRTRMVDP